MLLELENKYRKASIPRSFWEHGHYGTIGINVCLMGLLRTQVEPFCSLGKSYNPGAWLGLSLVSLPWCQSKGLLVAVILLARLFVLLSVCVVRFLTPGFLPLYFLLNIMIHSSLYSRKKKATNLGSNSVSHKKGPSLCVLRSLALGGFSLPFRWKKTS